MLSICSLVGMEGAFESRVIKKSRLQKSAFSPSPRALQDSVPCPLLIEYAFLIHSLTMWAGPLDGGRGILKATDIKHMA